MFKGAMVALVTPFRDGKVDEKALKELIEFQIQNGVDAIVPCGTTGESATLSHGEHERVVELTVEIAEGRIPVLAGTGSNSTAEAIRLTRHAREAKADAALMITPYYNKPTQEGLYQHYKKVAEEVDIPVLPETVARLAEAANIVGIKEASGSIQQISELVSLCPDDFSVLSGDDFITFPLLAVGGKGVISVTSNIAPKPVSQLIDAFFEGDFEKARALHYQLLPLSTAMFLETNPIPVKTALGLMGKIAPELRMPLSPMSAGNLAKLEQTLKNFGLIP
jgi:4-hydroxy-tetrahydrodipicolinate synthase